MTALALPTVLDIAAAAAVADQLRLVVATDADVRIDGEPVERIGVAGLQMLASAQRTVAGLGRSFVIERPSAALAAAAQTAGVAPILFADSDR